MQQTATGAVLPLVPSDEERQMREAVRASATRARKDYSRQKARPASRPRSCGTRWRSKGYLGVNLPEEWGGGGLGMSGLAAVGEEISAAGKLAAPDRRVAGDRRLDPRAPRAPRTRRRRWLRGIAAGTTKVAFAITEPDAGTNSHNISTSLGGTRERIRLNGQKTYISGVEHADAVLVVARTRLTRTARSGCRSLVIVDVDSPGFTRDKIPMPFIGPDLQWQLFFDDVEVEEDRLIGGENGGLGPVFDGLNPERIMGATVAVGAGLRALDKASAYASEREVWGAPIGTHQGVSHPLAQAKIELELARLMTQKAAALYDAGAPARARREHGQVRGRGGGDQVRRPGDPDARRQRLRAGVRPERHVVGSAAHANGAGFARDDPQLRRRALTGAPEELLT